MFLMLKWQDFRQIDRWVMAVIMNQSRFWRLKASGAKWHGVCKCDGCNATAIEPIFAERR